jgi:hypothetical protein
VHPVKFSGSSAHLAWQWRMEKQIENADLRTRSGDDTAVKVCVFFDMPMDNIPFADRQNPAHRPLQDQRPPCRGRRSAMSGDARLAAGTALDNAFTRRMRYIVVRSGAGP